MVNRWLITGGCGFLGTALIRTLLDKKLAEHITVLDNLTVGKESNLVDVCRFSTIDGKDLGQIQKSSSETVRLVKGDIRDAEIASEVCRNMDGIVHLAANTGVPASVKDPCIDMESNVIGTFNMLEGARRHKVRRFIFASSGAPAGEVEPPIHEEIAPHPVSPYGASKLAGEGYCSAYYRSYGIETVVLRFSNVYGPGSTHKTSVVAKFINQASRHDPLLVYGDGSQTRDFIFIDDLIQAIILSANKDGVGGEIFQIATGKETTVAEMTQLLVGILKKQTSLVPKLINEAPRLGDVRRNYSDISKARSRLGWNNEVDLETGLGITVRWFLEQAEINADA